MTHSVSHQNNAAKIENILFLLFFLMCSDEETLIED